MKKRENNIKLLFQLIDSINEKEFDDFIIQNDLDYMDVAISLAIPVGFDPTLEKKKKDILNKWSDYAMYKTINDPKDVY